MERRVVITVFLKLSPSPWGFQAQGGAVYSNKRSLSREVFNVGRASGTKLCRLLMEYQGGNFHLKVGGAKGSGNAGDPMLGVAVIPK